MLGLQLSIYLTLSTLSLVYLLNKYLWRAYYAPHTVLGLKEVTFSGGEGKIQNTLGIYPVAMIEVTWTEKGRGHPLWSLEVHGVSEGFPEEMMQNWVLRGEIGFNQVRLWKEGEGWYSRQRAWYVGRQSNGRKRRDLGNTTSSVWHRVIRMESGIGLLGSAI